MANIQQVSLTAPTDYSAEAERIARNRRMAEMLQQQATQPVEAGTMAGGYYVPTSPLVHLAQALKGYSGMAAQRQGDTDMKALAAQRRGDMTSDMLALSKALRGTPASSETIVDEQAKGGEGEVSTISAPAISPTDSLQAALPNLRTPEATQMGFGYMQAQIADQMKPPTIQDLGDKFGLMKNGVIVGYLPKGATPDAALKETGAQTRHATPSGSAILSESGQNQRHANPSGSVMLQERGQNLRHGTASGSAILQERGQNWRHGVASGSAILQNDTTRRGQDQAVDPIVQGRLSEAKAAGNTRGEAQAQAQITLPQAVEKANTAISLVDQMVGSLGRPMQPGEEPVAPHPGFSTVVGAGAPGWRFVHGTDAANFDALLDQVKGGAFLQAFESLKGGGAITQIEGEKATQAITRMQRAQSEAEFVKAAREFQENARKGMELAQQRAGTAYNGPDRRGVPSGVDAAVWAVMTPQEKALWNR